MNRTAAQIAATADRWVLVHYAERARTNRDEYSYPAGLAISTPQDRDIKTGHAVVVGYFTAEQVTRIVDRAWLGATTGGQDPRIVVDEGGRFLGFAHITDTDHNNPAGPLWWGTFTDSPYWAKGARFRCGRSASHITAAEITAPDTPENQI